MKKFGLLFGLLVPIASQLYGMNNTEATFSAKIRSDIARDRASDEEQRQKKELFRRKMHGLQYLTLSIGVGFITYYSNKINPNASFIVSGITITTLLVGAGINNLFSVKTTHQNDPQTLIYGFPRFYNYFKKG